MPSLFPRAATENEEFDGVRSKNELLDGAAKMIGPGEGGVNERAKDEALVGISVFRFAGRLGKGIIGPGGEHGWDICVTLVFNGLQEESYDL